MPQPHANKHFPIYYMLMASHYIYQSCFLHKHKHMHTHNVGFASRAPVGGFVTSHLASSR